MSETKTGKGGAIGAVIGTIVLAAACAAAGWIGGGFFNAWSQKKMQAALAARVRPNVAVVAVTNAEMRVYNLPERYVAHVESMKDVPLIPEVEGYIKEVCFKEGDLVKQGQVLYRIDDERFRAVVNQRKADLEVALAEQRRAKRYYERMQNADERGITQLERDNAEAASEKGNATVLQAKANLVVAEYYLKRTVIVAPIAGKIGKTSRYEGDFVAPSMGELAKIVQVDPIRVRFPMTDRAFMTLRSARLRNSAPANRLRLLLPDGTEYAREGEIDFDDNEMSDATATISVRAKFANPDQTLVPNCYVTLLSDFKAPPKFLAVPQQCLIELSGGNQGVWVVRSDMTVEQRSVTTKESFGGWTPIVTGLKAGERVVLSGVGKLATGMKVSFSTPTGNDDIQPGYVPPLKD